MTPKPDEQRSAAKGWDSPYDHEPRIVGNGASPLHPAYGRDGFVWTCSCGRRGRRRFVQRHEAMLAWERHV